MDQFVHVMLGEASILRNGLLKQAVWEKRCEREKSARDKWSQIDVIWLVAPFKTAAVSHPTVD